MPDKKVQNPSSRAECKASGIGISVNDLTGRFLLVNPAYCRITGYSKRDLESRTFQSITHPHDLRSNWRLARRMFAGEISSIVYEKRYIRNDSSVIWVRNTVFMMRDGSGKAVRSVAVAEPITAAQSSTGVSAVMPGGFRLLSESLYHSEEEERRRIARDLHDSTGQLLTGLVMTLTRLQNPGFEPPQRDQLLAEALDLARQCSSEVRTLSYLLHPPLLEEFGLASALRTYAEGFTHRTGIELKLAVPHDLGRLPRAVEMAIFRIVQEALANIHRHSGSLVGAITLQRLRRRIVLEVLDWGLGLRGSSAGVGLSGMRERARSLGGTLEIKSSRIGTRILVNVPLSGSDSYDTHPDRR